MLDADAVEKKKRVDDICDRCNSDVLGMKQAADLLEKEFADQGLLIVKVVDPKETGWSPRNRDSYGGCPARALELLDHIATVGFSLADMEHTTFEQVKPGSTETQTFNENLAEGDMASAPASPAIKYGSIAGSHAYAGFRAIIAGVPHTSELCSKDGRLSIEVLQERDPIYAKYAVEGVRAKVLRARRGRADEVTDGRASAPASVPALAPVLAPASPPGGGGAPSQMTSPQVLHWSVPEQYPRAIDIIQSARNMNRREQGESEVQIMHRMWKTYRSNAGIQNTPIPAYPTPLFR